MRFKCGECGELGGTRREAANLRERRVTETQSAVRRCSGQAAGKVGKAEKVGKVQIGHKPKYVFTGGTPN